MIASIPLSLQLSPSRLTSSRQSPSPLLSCLALLYLLSPLSIYSLLPLFFFIVGFYKAPLLYVSPSFFILSYFGLQHFISFLVLNLDDLNLILKSYAAFAITPLMNGGLTSSSLIASRGERSIETIASSNQLTRTPWTTRKTMFGSEYHKNIYQTYSPKTL